MDGPLRLLTFYMRVSAMPWISFSRRREMCVRVCVWCVRDRERQRETRAQCRCQSENPRCFEGNHRVRVESLWKSAHLLRRRTQITSSRADDKEISLEISLEFFAPAAGHFRKTRLNRIVFDFL